MFHPLPVLDRRWPLLLLPLLVMAVYGWSLPGHFFMDDIVIVQTNAQVYSPQLKTIFTSDYWGVGENSGLFRPLTILSFALNQMFLGDGASGYLLVNLALHAGVSILLYLFLEKIGVAVLVAWLAAALFALHPIHAEAVVELVGRAELLAALFMLVALLCSRQRSRWSTPLVLIFFVLAILSKENGIVLVAIIPTLDLFLSRPQRLNLLRDRAALYSSLLLVTALWLAYRIFVVHYGIPTPSSFDPYSIPFATVDAPTRILSALKLQWIYLGKLFIPYHLQGMYPVKTVLPFISWLSLQGVLVVVGLLFLVFFSWQGWQERRWWGLAIVLYIISFAPTSNILFSTGFTMADRAAYFPSLWFCTGFVAWLYSLSRRVPLRAAVLVGVLLLVIYGIAGANRAWVFRLPRTLWESDLAIDPGNELSMLMLVSHLRTEGRPLEGVEIVRRLLVHTPDSERALNAYAWLLLDLKRSDEAITVAKRSIALEPPGTKSSAKLILAAAYIQLGRYEEARDSLEVVRTLDLKQPVYWELQGKIAEARGDMLEALTCYQQEASLSGGRSPDGLLRLGRVLLRLNQLATAETFLRREVHIHPRSAEGWTLLGITLARQGRRAEALEALQDAVELQPDSVEYRATLDQWRVR